MPTVDHLLFLMENGAAAWRVRLSARAVLAKVILSQPIDARCLQLIELREAL
jgi:hypothetical protein